MSLCESHGSCSLLSTQQSTPDKNVPWRAELPYLPFYLQFLKKIIPFLISLFCFQQNVVEELHKLEINDKREEENVSAESVRDFFVNYHKNKENAEKYADEGDDADQMLDENQQEDESESNEAKEEVPLHIKMVEQVRYLL